MADPVEIVLDFLQRHQFAKAEAAFKTELLARGKGERPPLSSENVVDWDLHLCPHVLQGIDSSVTIADEEMATCMPERDTWRVSTNEDEEAGGIPLERVRSPPEKQLYVEYESGKPESQDSLCTPPHEFAFENVRTSQEAEAAVPLAGPYVSSPIYEVETAVQGASWTTSIQQVERSLPGMQSASSSEPLTVENQAWQFNSERAEQASTWDNEGMCRKQHLKPTTAFDILPGSRNQAQQQQLHKNEMLQKEFDIKCDKSGIPCNTSACVNVKQVFKGLEKQDHSSLHNEVKVPRSNLPAVKGQVEGSSEKVEQRGEGILQVKNGFITSLTSEGSFKGTALKTLLPLSSLKPSQSDEQQRVLMSDFSVLNDQKNASVLSWNGGEVEKFEKTRVPVIGNGAVGLPPYVENLDLSSNGVHGPEELPRPPPVRLHSMDKNMDIFKNGGSAVENESSTRGFESASLRIIGSTPEGTFGWGALVDGSLGQDMPISGLKWPVLRPSVSQGIVEASPEQLSGFAMAADGQSEKWYPDEYCDSDTYEDDDDPGYHRQPIEDEEWFFAHEIDYPSDEERARQHTDKNTLTVPKQSKKLEEDGGSFVEEESYFSGEEYYRLQAAKKELYKSQQSELRNQVDQAQFTYTSLYSTHNDNDLSTLSRGDDDGNKYDGQIFDTEELSLMRSQPVWKGFMRQAEELEQAGVVLRGYRLEGGCADGVDDDNHGSVRSGGILVSSDAADVGSEVRDSLLGGSSEGDPESFREQELVAYGPARGKFDSQGFLNNKEGRHVEVKSAPVQHLDEDDDEHDMILQYYNEAWGHSKRANEREASSRSTTELGVSTNDLSKSKHCSNKATLDNGGFGFEGFSFPSPSSTGDVAVSRAGSGKSLWSNRESTAQGEETDGYGSSMVGPDDTLAAWKRKSNHSSPIIGSSEENLPNLNLSNHSSASFHSTDEYVSLEAREHGLKESDVGGQLPKVCQPSVQEEEDAAAAQEELRTLVADEDQYEIFDLRIIHRKNRTGFEEDKEFAVMINSVIAGRYHVTEYLGSAAFSKAIQAHDLHTGMDVCMKIIKNNKDFFDQSLDEIKLLKFINKHDPADKYHILRLYDYFYHREHLFIVCELLRANLYEFHKFNRESGGEVYFTMPRLQSITRQCLEALEFLHRLGIIHCDLKPENILVKSYSRCEIKIIDLGSSCFQTDQLCSYVQSRSYRAPEVILGLPYDQKIDIWSLGCILAELCTGNVLFQNDSLATLLARVVGILGPIDPEVLTKGRDTHKYFTKNHMLYERNQETDQLEYLLPKKTSLSHRLPMGDQGFVEFVRYLLQSNPAKRPSATEALQHSWLSYPYEPISS